MSPEERADHFSAISTAFRKGNVVPLLGAGVNMTPRPAQYVWTLANGSGPAFLPNGTELARHLAHEYSQHPGINCTLQDCPLGGTAAAVDLMQISQGVEVEQGAIPLSQSLNAVFVRDDYPISVTHRLLARIPQLLSGEKPAARYQLIMTTNYDDLMERAFDAEQQDYDLVWYQAQGLNRGRFLHKEPGKTPTPIDRPNQYSYPFFTERPTILKLHGTAFDGTGFGSYVITEDHYLDYTAQVDHRALPKTLTARWVNLLYLGYGLRDYNLRVLVRRLQASDGMSRKSWAVMLNPRVTDKEYWQQNHLTVVDDDLKDYIRDLERSLAT